MLIHAVEAEYIRDYAIKVRFDDGSTKLVDLEPYTRRGGGSVLSLIEPFSKVFSWTLILFAGPTVLIYHLNDYMKWGKQCLRARK